MEIVFGHRVCSNVNRVYQGAELPECCVAERESGRIYRGLRVPVLRCVLRIAYATVSFVVFIMVDVRFNVGPAGVGVTFDIPLCALVPSPAGHASRGSILLAPG